jgi:leucyl aminopeptidase (aminopeptidase T)
MEWAVFSLAQRAGWVVREMAAVQPGEQVLVAADYASDFAVVEALTAAVAAAGAEPTVAVMPPRLHAGAPATRVMWNAVNGADVVICPSTTVLHFTKEIRQALTEKRIRLVSISIGRELMLEGAGAADPAEVRALTQRVYDVGAPASSMRITAENGTEFRCSIEGRLPNLSIGRADEPGRIGTFPFGEVPHAPIEGTAEGTVVFDGPMHTVGQLSEPIRYEVRAGRVVEVAGGAQADRMRQLIEANENADVIGEVSVGTNPGSRFEGDVQEAKKRLGCVHIAVGDATGIRGLTWSPLHIDGVIRYPTVWADETLVVRDGELAI